MAIIERTEEINRLNLLRSYGTGSDSDRVKARARMLANRRQDVGAPTMVTSLHHVNVTVPPELEAETKVFYAEVVGLRQVSKPSSARQSGAWYQIGDNQLHLSVEDEAHRPLSSRHVCFRVSDLAEAEKKFREAGVEIIPDARPIAGTRRFYVRDPGGNQLEIVQA